MQTFRLHFKVTTYKNYSYRCNRKAQVACVQSFALWQQATMEFT